MDNPYPAGRTSELWSPARLARDRPRYSVRAAPAGAKAGGRPGGAAQV